MILTILRGAACAILVASCVAQESVTFVRMCGPSCYVFNVSVPNVPDRAVRLNVTPTAAPIGWVLLNSGGNGGGFMASQPGGAVLVSLLSARGLIVVDRAWDAGWIQPGFGVKPQSRRGAALISFLLNNAHRNGKPLAVIGNSGGSSELAYSLTTWERYPDIVVLCSGPPMVRLQHLCPNPPAASWVARCASLLSASGFVFSCGTPPVNNPGGFLCPLLLPPARLPEDSILHSHARTSFPVPVTMLLGEDDCTDVICQGMEFQAATGIPMKLVADTPHFLPGTAAGRRAIVAVLFPD